MATVLWPSTSSSRSVVRPSSLDSIGSTASASSSTSASSSSSSLISLPSSSGPHPSPQVASASNDSPDMMSSVLPIVQPPSPQPPSFVDTKLPRADVTPFPPQGRNPSSIPLLRSISFRRDKPEPAPPPVASSLSFASIRLKTKASTSSFLPWKQRSRADTSPSPSPALKSPTSIAFPKATADPPPISEKEYARVLLDDPLKFVFRWGSAVLNDTNKVPYCMSYNSSDLEVDYYNNQLLFELANGPSFHAYGQEPPARVLDLGCGGGNWVIRASEEWPTTEFWGLDLMRVQIMHDQLRDVLCLPLAARERIHWINYDFLNGLDFPAGTFDMVRMAYIGLGLNKGAWRKLLSEVQRILKPGGRVEFIDEPLIFPDCGPLDESSRDIPADLEAHFLAMLQARRIAVDPFAEETKRVPTTLEACVGPTTELYHYEMAVPASGDSDSTRSNNSGKRSRARLLLDGQSFEISSPHRHAARSSHVLIGHKESLWEYLEKVYGPQNRQDYEDAIWEYESSMCRRTGVYDDHSSDWEDEEMLSSKKNATLRRRPNPFRSSVDSDTTLAEKARVIRRIRVYEALNSLQTTPTA